jgi:branched-chain amino acid transport system substrate-binding protein
MSCSYAAPTIPIIPMLESAQVLSLQGGGTNPDVLGHPFHFLSAMIFAVDPVDGALEFLHKTYPNAKRCVFTGTLENGAVAIKERGPAAWMKLVPDGVVAGTEIHELLITDFSALVARVKQENPDVIFTTSFADDLGFQIKALREAGVTAPIMTIDMTSNVPKLAGSAIGQDVYLAVDYYDAKNPNPFNVQFVEAHNKEYGKDPEYFGANFYEHLFILWDTVRQTLKADGTVGRGTDLRDALVNNNKFKTVYGGDANTVGTGSWDLTEHTCSKPMGVYKLAADGSLTFMETITKNQVLG